MAGTRIITSRLYWLYFVISLENANKHFTPLKVALDHDVRI